ncbi:MAG: TRAM domain-containing protein [Candidatus Nanoperiomorbaceae bacterium]
MGNIDIALTIIVVCSVLILMETSFLAVNKLRRRTAKLTRGSLLLDTSAIMDGRIVDVAKTGILAQELIIPRSVLDEMQLLADKADSEKRQRARHGLELARALRGLDEVSVSILQDGRVDHGGVDERLIELARKTGASIATVDYNLNKLARTMDITVVNMNELAQVMRANKLPGERAEIEIIQPGANRDQAVGYLDDGTMVVVEDAKKLIGQRVKIEIQRSLQTEAGRMIFAKRVDNHEYQKSANHTVAKNEPAKAFHSDKLKNQKRSQSERGQRNHRNNESSSKQSPAHVKQSQQPNQSSVATTASSRAPRRKTSRSAEGSMVALANKMGKQ